MNKLMEIIVNPPHTIKIVCLAIMIFVLCLAFYQLCKSKETTLSTYCLSPENRIEDESTDPLDTSRSYNNQQNKMKKFDPGQWYKDSLLRVAHTLVPTRHLECRPKDEISVIV